MQFIKTIGFLRYCHLILIVALILIALVLENSDGQDVQVLDENVSSLGQGAHQPSEYAKIISWLSIVAPALMPIFIFTLPLDILFCIIRKQDPPPPRARTLARLSFIIRLNIATLLVLILAYSPFIVRLLRPAFL